MSETFSDDWFYGQLKENRPLDFAHKAFRAVHGERKQPIITIDILDRHNSATQIKECRSTLSRLDKIVPSDLAEIVRYTAVIYANFCDEIFAGLDTFYFQSILMEWFLHSESSLKGKRYRDHLTHQLKVCLLGLGFLEGKFFGKELLNDIVTSLGTNSMMARFLEGESIEARELTPETVSASWLLASMFHDLGYCFLVHVKTAGQLSKVSNFFSTKFTDEIWAKVKGRFSEHSYIVSFFKKYGTGLKEESTLADVQEHIKKSAFWSENHSVVGALYLLYTLGQLEEDAASAFGNEQGLALKKRLRLVFEIAALAVLTHDIDSSKKRQLKNPDEQIKQGKSDESQQSVQKTPMMKEGFKISFEEVPVSYLLGVCDQLQEWGRVRVERNAGEESCTDSYIVDCKAIELSLEGETLVINVALSEGNKSHPSYQILGENIEEDVREKVKTKPELLARYSEGRMAILNNVYGVCPLWKDFDVRVTAADSTKFSAEDCLAVEQK